MLAMRRVFSLLLPFVAAQITDVYVYDPILEQAPCIRCIFLDCPAGSGLGVVETDLDCVNYECVCLNDRAISVVSALALSACPGVNADALFATSVLREFCAQYPVNTMKPAVLDLDGPTTTKSSTTPVPAPVPATLNLGGPPQTSTSTAPIPNTLPL
jgi:hypothetical protein